MKFETFEEIIAWQKSKELTTINDETTQKLIFLSTEISRLLSGLIKPL